MGDHLEAVGVPSALVNILTLHDREDVTHHVDNQPVLCASCHGSPHTMEPSHEASDNAVVLAWQSAVVPIASCAACHATSHGDGLADFAGQHGGSDGLTSACMVRHTEIDFDVDQAPHQFQWNAH